MRWNPVTTDGVTDEQRRLIVAAYVAGDGFPRAARLAGVTGSTWKAAKVLKEEGVPFRQTGAHGRPRNPFVADQLPELRKLREAGVSWNELAEISGQPKTTVRRAVQRHTNAPQR